MSVYDPSYAALVLLRGEPKQQKWVARGQEPALAEVMRDPIVHLVMRRDRLSFDDVWPILERGRQVLLGRR